MPPPHGNLPGLVRFIGTKASLPPEATEASSPVTAFWIAALMLSRRVTFIGIAGLLAGCSENRAAIPPRQAHEQASRNELLLVDIRNGYVVDVIHNFFW